MDVNDLRSLVTVVSLLVFVGIVVWAWSRRNERDFSEAAQLPFQERPSVADERAAQAVTGGAAT